MGPVRGQQRLGEKGWQWEATSQFTEHWALGAVAGALWSGLPAPSSVGSTVLDTVS